MHFPLRLPCVCLPLTVALACAGALARPALAEEETTVYLGGISDPFLGLSERYGDLAFNSAALRHRREYDRFTFDITAAAVQHGRDSTIPRYELAYSFADDVWQIGVAKKLRNWGPSRHSSLFLSRNAPAMHSAYISKNRATPFDVPVLEWLGPWDGEFFVGTTDGPGQPENALFMGMRFAFQPIRGLKFELLRTAQWGGDGFPKGAQAFWDVLVGRTNEGTSDNANQLAGVSLSYAVPIQDSTLRVYGQIAGEDEAGGRPSCRFYMAGIELESRLFGAPVTVGLETVDTRTNLTTNGFCGPNQAYNNPIYSYTNKGVVLGAAVDTQGQSTNLYVSHAFRDFTLDWSIGHYLVNDTSDPNHRLSSTRVSGPVATVGISKQFDRMRMDGILAYQGFDLDNADMKDGLRAGLGLSIAF